MMRTTTNNPRGYTIIEMMVVVGIIVLLVAVAVPSFSAMAYSTERSLAENSLRRAMTAARDVALRSERGGDGAIVFLLEPGEGMRIVPAEQVGSMQDLAGLSNVALPDQDPQPFTIERDVFVPTPFAESISLPGAWYVRGFAAPGSMVDVRGSGTQLAEWYNSPLYGGNRPGAAPKGEGNWVLPETGLYDKDASFPAAGGGAPSASGPATPSGRQTFMVRFDARTGALSGSRRSSLLVDPRPSSADRPDVQPILPDGSSNAWTRVDRADNLSRWATRVLTDPDPDANGTPYQAADLRKRFELLGRMSNDTVLVKPVTRLALADERRLARGIRARGLNAQTRSLYAPFDAARANGAIELDRALFGGDSAFNADVVRRNINSWIVGDTANDAVPNPGPGDLIGDGVVNLDPDSGVAVDRPESALFSISPYSGELVEVNP